MRITSKADMTNDKIEEYRLQMQLYTISVHYGTTRMLDYFETKTNFYIVYEWEESELIKLPKYRDLKMIGQKD